MACGILVPQPGIEPVPPAVEAQSLNHQTTREVPRTPFCKHGVILWWAMDYFGESSIQQVISAHLISAQYYGGHKDKSNATPTLKEIIIHK